MNIILHLLALYGLKCFFFGTRGTYKVRIKHVNTPNLPKYINDFPEPRGKNEKESCDCDY